MTSHPHRRHARGTAGCQTVGWSVRPFAGCTANWSAEHEAMPCARSISGWSVCAEQRCAYDARKKLPIARSWSSQKISSDWHKSIGPSVHTVRGRGAGEDDGGMHVQKLNSSSLRRLIKLVTRRTSVTVQLSLSNDVYKTGGRGRLIFSPTRRRTV